MPNKHVPHYFVGLADIGPMTEVTLKEWCSAERSAGFRPYGGGSGPATGGFSGGGVKGTIKYAKVIAGKEMCMEEKHPIRECTCYTDWDKRIYVWKD